jgi:spore maturation protein B
MIKTIAGLLSLWLIPLMITGILFFGIIKKVPVYETFVEGARDGLKVSGNIFPYLIAIIVAVSMLRASGAVELAQNVFSGILNALNIPADILPVMIVRSLSGSAVLGMFADIAGEYGPDSYPAKLAAVMVGSSETTFYVLAVYFGSVGIRKFRHAVMSGLLADAVGIIAAIAVSRWLFL